MTVAQFSPPTAKNPHMSFDIFTAFATDENLENNGTTFPLGKGASVIVARAGNPAYAKLLNKLVEQSRVALDAEDEAAEELSKSIMIDVYAQTILLGWNNLSFKGEELGDYSVEKAKKLLAVKDFRIHIDKLSNQIDAYKVKAEVATGNV